MILILFGAIFYVYNQNVNNVGVKIDKLDIFVESENDVVTISGRKDIPKHVKDDDEEKEYLCKECRWGEFYRQIILPEEINVSKIESVVENGVLVLTLPLLRIQTKGKKRIEVKEMEEDEEDEGEEKGRRIRV